MKKSLLYAIIIQMTRIIFKLFYHLRIYGIEHYIEGGAIIAPNHVSHLDAPIVAISCLDQIHFLARKSLFRPLFGRFIKALNTHPVQGHMSNLSSIKMVCRLLKEGYKILIFPEGTRSDKDKIGKIKPGIGMLIAKSQSVILPVYIHGTYHIWNRKRKIPRCFGKTAVIFGSPIYWKDYMNMDQKEAKQLVTSELNRSLGDLRKWYEKGAKGIPP